MTKKARRVRKPRARAASKTPEPEQIAEVPASNKTRQDSTEKFRQEYAYVLRDLRHVLFLALAMFVLLVLLNLILPYLV